MLSLPLFAASLVLAPTGNSSRVELVSGGGFNAATVTMSSPGSLAERGLSLGGQGGVGFTLFGPRVVDDDAPPSLQPYLQYAAQLHVDGGGGGFRFSPDSATSGPGNDSSNGYANVNASGYFDRTLYGYLGIGVRYRSDSANQFTSLLLPISAAAGLRLGQVRLSIGWSVTPTRYGDDVFKVPFWGGAYAQAYAVVHLRLSLSANVNVLEGGAGAGGGATVYLARRFSVGASVSGSHAHNSDLGFTFDGVGAEVDFEAWTGPRFAIAVDYSITWGHWVYANASAEDDYTNTIGLTFLLRPR
jgi:hypothetical protein